MSIYVDEDLLFFFQSISIGYLLSSSSNGDLKSKGILLSKISFGEDSSFDFFLLNEACNYFSKIP